VKAYPNRTSYRPGPQRALADERATTRLGALGGEQAGNRDIGRLRDAWANCTGSKELFASLSIVVAIQKLQADTDRLFAGLIEYASHGRGTLISSDGQLNGARQTCLCLPVELLNAREGNF
jgi:hypothetical protein